MNIIADTFADAYKSALTQVYYNYDFESAPRGMKIKEDLNAVITIKDPTSNLYKNEVRSSPVSYIAKELVWYLSGDRSTDYIGKYADLWNRIKNADGTVNSNYGNLAFYKSIHDKYLAYSQYSWALNMLLYDKDSRQAIMHFNDRDHQKYDVKDFVCTLSCIFHIRDNELYMTTTMRSQDIILGLPADFVWFSFLHQQMYSHLRAKYPELTMGTYTHIVHSLHLYEKHFNLAEQMLEKPFETDQMPFLVQDFVDQGGKLTQSTASMICQAKDKCNHAFNINKFSDALKQWIYDNA